MPKPFRFFYLIAAGLASLSLLVLNVRLYHPGPAAYAQPKLGEDVVPQLHFIGSALRAGAGDEMQGLFPEGYFFNHVIYGLGWVEVGLRSDPHSTQYAEALQEAQWALTQLNSKAGVAPFDTRLTPRYGVFYAGWKNWLAGGILLMQPPAGRDPQAVASFEADTDSLAEAFAASPTPFLESYAEQAWPVDNTVAVAALGLHDKVLPAKYADVIAHWLSETQQRLDPTTGLIPHRVDYVSGLAVQGPRASSLSVITRFLLEIDPAFGQDQYQRYRQHFLTPLLGVPGAREYPDGRAGFGDVDSGPLVFGFSSTATVVTIATAHLYGDNEVADALLPASEAVGLPLSWGDSKRYMLGLMPVGDAFLVWAKTSSLWIADPPAAQPQPALVDPNWRWPLHGLALAMAIMIWLPGLLLLRRK